MEERIVLRELRSGQIVIVWDGVCSRIQFNANCIDALPYCKAMCCRLRVGYSVELKPEEVGLYDSREHPAKNGLHILNGKPTDYSCVYLGGDSKCSIHETKPSACKTWHCSPGGEPEDKTIVRREAGWLLSPMRMEEAEAIRYQLEQRGGDRL